MLKIYAKSAKGQQELQGNRTLSLRQRQLLIMSDGKRSSVDIAKLFNTFDALQVLNDLEKLGYIEDTFTGQKNSAKVASIDNTGSHTNKDVFDDLTHEHFLFIKQFLIDELLAQVGIIGYELSEKIKQSNSSQTLKLLIPHWHMMLRSAKNGRKAGDDAIERLNHLLANPLQAMSSQMAS